MVPYLVTHLKTALSTTLDLFYPSRCIFCKKTKANTKRPICGACDRKLPAFPQAFCLRCGQAQHHNATWGCPACHVTAHTPDATYFAFTYHAPLSDAIIAFKFRDQPELAPVLTQLLWERLGDDLLWEAPQIILPAPLHYQRLWQRGYNQAALLARSLAKKLNRPLETRAFKRVRRTTPQVQLKFHQRMSNMQGAFRADPRRLAGKDILLIDDVYTTGATVSAMVTALRQASVARIAVVCLAHTPPNR
ncbi:ComF family protein [Magnetococcales bacterium HHB-1]